MLRLWRRIEIGPERYALITLVALASLVAIIFTGAAVRLTGSGLGCPDWPKCHGGYVAPLETHAWIEFGNRLITGFVGFAAGLAAALAWRRRPFRRDLAFLGALLPVGILGQAILGGFTVKYHLAPGFVMGHYILSLLILVAAFALTWRARYEPSERGSDEASPRAVRATRALLPVGAALVFLGTAASASGPHGGGTGTGQTIDRLEWWGIETLRTAVHLHGAVGWVFFAVAALAWWLLRRDGSPPSRRRPLLFVLGLLPVQGGVGVLQYHLKLPAEMVWIHVVLGTCLWLGILWSIAAVGRPAPVYARRRSAAASSAATAP